MTSLVKPGGDKPSTVELFVTYGTTALDAGDFGAARTLAHDALGIDEDYAPAKLLSLLAWGQQYIDTREYGKAMEKAQEALEVDPQSERARNLLAEAKRKGDARTQAINSLSGALRAGWQPDTQRLDDEQEQAWDKDEHKDDTPE